MDAGRITWLTLCLYQAGYSHKAVRVALVVVAEHPERMRAAIAEAERQAGVSPTLAGALLH